MTDNSAEGVADPWAVVPGQPELVRRLRAAVESPVHAYLFVGPEGAGTFEAARVFAGELLAGADPDHADRHRRLARPNPGELGNERQGRHPDIVVMTPAGNQLRREEDVAPMIINASRSPVEGNRKALIVERFHTATPAAAAAMLKTIEEPPPTAIFILLAEDVLPEHVTIASRCTRFDVTPIGDDVIRARLVDQGVDADRAAVLATAAGGSLDRALLLVGDPAVERRWQSWRSIPSRLDGTGAAVAVCVSEVQDQMKQALVEIEAAQADELAAFDATAEELGTRTTGRKTLIAEHDRVKRREKTRELRFGLAVLAGCYRDAIVGGDQRAELVEAVEKLREVPLKLIRNPNETLLLQDLLLSLPRI